MFIIYFFFYSGFPKIGQGKEETGIGENERKIWNQQGQVTPLGRRTPENVLFINSTLLPKTLFQKSVIVYVHCST